MSYEPKPDRILLEIDRGRGEGTLRFVEDTNDLFEFGESCLRIEWDLPTEIEIGSFRGEVILRDFFGVPRSDTEKIKQVLEDMLARWVDEHNDE